MSFLKDYLFYNSGDGVNIKGNECPRNFHIWTAFCVLSSAVSRRVWLHQGYYTTFTNIYSCLVGKQGTRKTTAKDQGYDLLIESLKDEVPLAAESMSKEAITQFMSKDENMRRFTHPKTQDELEYRPFTIFCTELKNFVSINPVVMCDFLTTIYDRGHSCYDVKTKNKGNDMIIRPHVVFLACETPEWVQERLKLNIISGGFSRRVIWVYETQRTDAVTFPTVTKEQSEAWARCRAHLKRLWSLIGEFTWEPEAVKFYDEWYQGLRKWLGKQNLSPFMEGYYESKHTQLLKVAMLLACCEYKDPIPLVITKDLLELGNELLTAIEPNMEKLALGYGTNKLASASSKLLEIMNANGGKLEDWVLKKLVWTELQGRDFNEVVDHYLKTKQLFKFMSDDKKKWFFYTLEGAKREQDEKIKRLPPP